MINISKMHYVPTFYPPLVLHGIFPLFKPYRSNNVGHKSHIWSDTPVNSYLPSSPPGGCVPRYFSCGLDLKSMSEPVCTVAQWEIFYFIAAEWFIVASWWHFKRIISLMVIFDSHSQRPCLLPKKIVDISRWIVSLCNCESGSGLLWV